ncbi:hypothetical protein AX774_g6441 [Zancudomyces culisetae]|uniref:Uncharacterized protein n=1 Tax=Zancudomyces culisetae TaxID=1213189 RepID=A0A1R1PGL1_ZANCU|nr:hypothetical protein AX774_g7576 [Zancudomyces culisetae]OMH80114.1 hypothetical protein AX774_g6441 [Zancudomyces culisetae]|eukprot:OMH79024.1 hypothetical protein AX774_g7576 [Zancudomyces culisetae]
MDAGTGQDPGVENEISSAMTTTGVNSVGGGEDQYENTNFYSAGRSPSLEGPSRNSREYTDGNGVSNDHGSIRRIGSIGSNESEPRRRISRRISVPPPIVPSSPTAVVDMEQVFGKIYSAKSAPAMSLVSAANTVNASVQEEKVMEELIMKDLSQKTEKITLREKKREEMVEVSPGGYLQDGFHTKPGESTGNIKGPKRSFVDILTPKKSKKNSRINGQLGDEEGESYSVDEDDNDEEYKQLEIMQYVKTPNRAPAPPKRACFEFPSDGNSKEEGSESIDVGVAGFEEESLMDMQIPFFEQHHSKNNNDGSGDNELYNNDNSSGLDYQEIVRQRLGSQLNEHQLKMITDIIKEVENNKESEKQTLSEQLESERANLWNIEREYKEYLDLSGEYMDARDRANEELTKELAELTLERRAIHEQVNQLSNQVEQLQAELSSAQHELQSNREVVQQLEGAKRELENDIAVAAEREQMIFSHFSKQVAAEKDKNGQLEQQLMKLGGDNSYFKSQINRLELSLKRAKSEVQNLKDENLDLQKMYNDLEDYTKNAFLESYSGFELGVNGSSINNQCPSVAQQFAGLSYTVANTGINGVITLNTAPNINTYEYIGITVPNSSTGALPASTSSRGVRSNTLSLRYPTINRGSCRMLPDDDDSPKKNLSISFFSIFPFTTSLSNPINILMMIGTSIDSTNNATAGITPSRIDSTTFGSLLIHLNPARFCRFFKFANPEKNAVGIDHSSIIATHTHIDTTRIPFFSAILTPKFFHTTSLGSMSEYRFFLITLTCVLISDIRVRVYLCADSISLNNKNADVVFGDSSTLFCSSSISLFIVLTSAAPYSIASTFSPTTPINPTFTFLRLISCFFFPFDSSISFFFSFLAASVNVFSSTSLHLSLSSIASFRSPRSFTGYTARTSPLSSSSISWIPSLVFFPVDIPLTKTVYALIFFCFSYFISKHCRSPAAFLIA